MSVCVAEGVHVCVLHVGVVCSCICACAWVRAEMYTHTPLFDPELALQLPET